MIDAFVQTPFQLDPEAPCLGLVEYFSIADGIEATDRMLKKAVIQILLSRPAHPGKYLTLFTGTVEDVFEAIQSIQSPQKPSLVDFLFLPYLHEKVEYALLHPYNESAPFEAIGVLETSSVASLLVAADLAVKCACVHLVSIQLADHLGGKSFFTLTGEIGDLEVAMETAVTYVQKQNTFLQKIILPSPHPEMRKVLLGKNV